MEQKFKTDNMKKNNVHNANKHSDTTKKKKNKTILPIICLIFGLILGAIMGSIGVMVVLDNYDKESLSDDVLNIEIEQKSESDLSIDRKSEEEVKETNTMDVELGKDGFAIETPYVTLYYPNKWKNQVRVEQSEGNEVFVEFWATMEGKEDVQLFDIVFGEVDGILLGSVDGTSVYLIYTELEFDGNWSEEERSDIYIMQEDVNYIIEMLRKEDGFISAS